MINNEDNLTNLSGSNFILIRITNKDILRLIKGTGLEEFSVYEDDNLNCSDKDALQKFYHDYLESKDVVSCLQNYLRDKYNLQLTRDDFIKEEIFSATVEVGKPVSSSEAIYEEKYQTQALQRIDELEIGAAVIDNKWLWEHRAGFGYKETGIIKPVAWLVSGKNHYDLAEPHVTLISTEPIAYFSFDKTDARNEDSVSSMWFANNRSCSLRRFLSDIFAEAFSPSFTAKLILTSREFNGCVVKDKVFILSADELGGNEQGQLKTIRIGRVLPYFSQDNSDIIKKRRVAGFEKKITMENGQDHFSKHIWDVFEIEDKGESVIVDETYWTCSPVSFREGYLYIVFPDGRIAHVPGNDAGTDIYTVRVALNIKADTNVSVKPNCNGFYEIDGIGATVEKIRFAMDNIEVNSGESVSLVLITEPAYASDKRVKLKSTVEVVATVTPEGRIRAGMAGETTIIAQTLDGSNAEAACHIKVTDASEKIRLGDLDVGARVVDQSWFWEFKKGPNYSGKGEKKAVSWLVVGKDHYKVEGGIAHVTLMAEELVANHTFDDSKFRGDFLTSWCDSGQPDGRMGLRPFLNGELELPEQLNFHISVAGTMFDQRSANIEKLSEQTIIKLIREPENLYDTNAIAVTDSFGTKLGFVPAELAEFLAPLLDAGNQITVEIIRIRTRDKSVPKAGFAQLELYIKLECDKTCQDYIKQRVANNGSFYGAFSESFKKQVLVTFVPNVEINTNMIFFTQDRVFVPSHTELKGNEGPLYNYNLDSYQGFKSDVGQVLPYFNVLSQYEVCSRRVPVDTKGFYSYWTRSVCKSDVFYYKGRSDYSNNAYLLAVHVFSFNKGYITSVNAVHDEVGVRPLVNLKADTSVYAEPGSGWIYLISAGD